MHSSTITTTSPLLDVDTRKRLVRLSIYAIVLLNAFDALMTITWVSTGLAVEANPLMEPLLSAHPVLFYLAKIALVFLGTALLWRHQETRSAIVGTALLTAVYYALTLYHVNALGYVISWFL